MILKGAQRANAEELARHLLKPENEVIDVAELRGFASEHLMDALREIKAISRATKCKSYLYSLSFNPPANEIVSRKAFEDAIERAEVILGLSDQPRAVVYHTKHGRTHAHCVWSRIGPNLKAIKLNFPKKRLKGLSIQIYQQHGWDIPAGFQSGQEASPMTYTYQEYLQAKRGKFEARRLKAHIKTAWDGADSSASFEAALERSGLFLARGDSRGFVCLDYEGNIYSLSRWTGAKAKELRAKLGEPEECRDVIDTQAMISEIMTPRVIEYLDEATAEVRADMADLEGQRQSMVSRHSKQRQDLKARQYAEWEAENAERSARFAKGFRGLFQRLTGKHAKIAKANEAEAERTVDRFAKEQEVLREKQCDLRANLQSQIDEARCRHQETLEGLFEKIRHYRDMGHSPRGLAHNYGAQIEAMRQETQPLLAPSFE